MRAMTTTTALPRTVTARGLKDEYEAFATLVASLTADEWASPTRCEGFEVRDVAGHVIGLAEDVAAGVPGSRTAAEEAASVRDDSPQQAAARLRAAAGPIGALLDGADDEAWAGPSGVPDLTLGEGVLTLWYDTFVHGDDIRAAIGRPSETGDGLGASVAYLHNELAKRGFDSSGLEFGDDLQFVLAATGRADPAIIGADPSVNIYAE
jgi:uncharacterized protein (TIGR03083 family)